MAGRDSSFSDMDIGNVVKQTKDIQEPQDDSNDHNAVQDGLDGRLHRDEAIHQPEQNTHSNQNFQELN
jgi:hypothetical protein